MKSSTHAAQAVLQAHADALVHQARAAALDGRARDVLLQHQTVGGRGGQELQQKPRRHP